MSIELFENSRKTCDFRVAESWSKNLKRTALQKNVSLDRQDQKDIGVVIRQELFRPRKSR